MSLGDNTFVAVGDVHGCALSLERLIVKMENAWSRNPVYVFLGDYTDRGPDSKGVVDQLIEFNKTHECIFLRGNHDKMLLDAYEEGDWRIWLANGGVSTLKSYNSEPGDFKLPKAHYNFFSNTKLWWDTSEYFFVHGGLNPDKTIKENLESEQEKELFLWQRAHINASSVNWEKTVVFGHTPVKTPIIETKRIGLDTGCVYKESGMGILSAASLPELDFIIQNCVDF
ncbi:MAG: serine/threonine protein phosphatase [Balneolaceae bacterium]|nr:serine/threonine protein phosphatase [Balneolaceae bacterium]